MSRVKTDDRVPKPALSYYLTREEWLAAFAAWLVSFEKQCWPVNGRPAPSMEVDGVGEGLRHGIRVLAHAGYRFQVLDVALDGDEIVSRVEEPIETRNVRFLQKIAQGFLPNPLNAMSYLRELSRAVDLSLDLDPLLELEAEIKRDVQEAEEETTEEERLEFGLFLQKALATIGLRPGNFVDGKVN